jgi:hypothetical protein
MYRSLCMGVLVQLNIVPSREHIDKHDDNDLWDDMLEMADQYRFVSKYYELLFCLKEILIVDITRIIQSIYARYWICDIMYNMRSNYMKSTMKYQSSFLDLEICIKSEEFEESCKVKDLNVPCFLRLYSTVHHKDAYSSRHWFKCENCDDDCIMIHSDPYQGRWMNVQHCRGGYTIRDVRIICQSFINLFKMK